MILGIKAAFARQLDEHGHQREARNPEQAEPQRGHTRVGLRVDHTRISQFLRLRAFIGAIESVT